MPDCIAPNGTTQYLNRTDDTILTFGGGSFAVGMWVNLASTAATQVFAAKTSSPTVREFVLQFSGPAARFQAAVFDSSGTQYTAQADAFGAVSTGAWYFLLFVYDHENALVKIYVNGVKNESAVASPVVDTAAPLTVGARINSGTPGLFTSARLADFTIWQNKGAVPTDAEVVALYNGGARLRWHEIGQVVPRWHPALRDPFPLDELGGDRLGMLSGLKLSPVNAPGVAAALDFANPDLREPVTVASGTYAAGNLAGQATAEGDLWAQHATESQAITVGSDGLAYRGGTSNGIVYLDRFVPSNETPIHFRLSKKSAVVQAPGILYRLRSVSGSLNAYTWRYDNQTTAWQFGTFIGGSFNLVASFAATLTDGEIYDGIIRPNSLFHELWVKGPGDSDHRHIGSPYDDTLALQASGYVAVRVSGSGTSTSTTGYHIALDSIQRGTWAITDVVRLTAAGGTNSTYAGVHVAVPVVDANRLHVITDARYGTFQDAATMDLLKWSVPLADLAGELPLNWGSPVTLASAGSPTIGVGRRNSDPCYWVLPNGDQLMVYSEFPAGYSAVGGDPNPALAATAGGSGTATAAQVKMRRSTDGGLTWSAAVVITDMVRDTATMSVNYPQQQQGTVLPSGRVVCAMGFKIADGGAGQNGGQWVYTDSFAGQPSGSPSLASVVWHRGGQFPATAGEHSVAVAGDNLLLLPREYPANSTTWRYASVASDALDDNISSFTDLGLFNQPVRTGWFHDTLNLIYAHIATPQSGGRQTVRVYAGSSPETLAPLGGATCYPAPGVPERGGAQYPSIVVVEIDGVWYAILTWGRGGRPVFVSDWTNIFNSIGVGIAPYSALGLAAPETEPEPYVPAGTGPRQSIQRYFTGRRRSAFARN